MQQQEFLMLTEPDGFVVLRAYEDLLLLGRLNRKSLEVGPEFAVLSTPRAGALSFRREKLGVLHAAAIQSGQPVKDSPPVSPGEPSPSATSSEKRGATVVH